MATKNASPRAIGTSLRDQKRKRTISRSAFVLERTVPKAAMAASIFATAWKAAEVWDRRSKECEDGRVVIVGGGFAGVRAARKLNSNVTIVSKRDYFEFTPGVAHAMVDGTHANLTVKLESALPRADIKIIDEKDIVDVGESYVRVAGEVIPYDYLILATGSTYTPPLKPSKIEDSMRTREKAFRICSEALEDAANVLVIGAGVAGVELAASISSRYPNKKVYLADEHDRLLYKLPARASKYAERRLREMGIHLVLGERIRSRGMNGRTKIFECIASESIIEVEAAFFCSGKVPNSEFGSLSDGRELLEKDEEGHVLVNECLQSTRSSKIFVVGDLRAKGEREYIAGQAEREADYVVDCIRKLMDGKRVLRPFKTGAVRLSVCLGPSDGLMVRGARMIARGLIVPLVKQLIEWWTMWCLTRQFVDLRKRMSLRTS